MIRRSGIRYSDKIMPGRDMADTAPDARPRLAWAYAHCEALVRAGDRDRFLAGLFAPSSLRPHLFALDAFDLDTTRIRDVASQPVAGEIRLQWWRDAVGDEARGDVASHPVAAALLDTIERFRLPQHAFLDLLEARIFDLYDDPMPALADLEGYCGETASARVRLASLVLAGGVDPGAADAAGHAGVAEAVTDLLRAFPRHAKRGQVYVPQDVLHRHGATREDIVAGTDSAALKAALAEMRALARSHLDRLERLLPTVSATIAPAVLPALIAPLYLARMERRDYEPFRTVINVPQWRRQWALWRAARRFNDRSSPTG